MSVIRIYIFCPEPVGMGVRSTRHSIFPLCRQCPLNRELSRHNQLMLAELQFPWKTRRLGRPTRKLRLPPVALCHSGRWERLGTHTRHPSSHASDCNHCFVIKNMLMLILFQFGSHKVPATGAN